MLQDSAGSCRCAHREPAGVVAHGSGIRTLAGVFPDAPPVTALEAPISAQTVFVDSEGTLFYYDDRFYSIFKLEQGQAPRFVAGSLRRGDCNPTTPANPVSFRSVSAIAKGLEGESLLVLD